MHCTARRESSRWVEHLQMFFSNVKIADESDAIRLREVILPYVVDALRRAKKDAPMK